MSKFQNPDNLDAEELEILEAHNAIYDFIS